MRIIKCDRCGSVIQDDSDNVGYVAINWREINTGEMVDDNPFEHWDLCEDCIKAIQAFIQKPTKEEKFEKIVESVNAGKKAPKEKKKYVPKLGIGKAQALRDRGWPVIKIAQEMKVSEPTILKWTHPAPEPKKPKPLEWAEHEPDLDPVIKATSEAKPFRAPEETEA